MGQYNLPNNLSFKVNKIHYVNNVFGEIMEVEYNFFINDAVNENIIRLIEDENYSLRNFVFDLIVEPNFSFEEFHISDDDLEGVLVDFANNNKSCFLGFDYNSDDIPNEFLTSLTNQYNKLKKMQDKEYEHVEKQLTKATQSINLPQNLFLNLNPIIYQNNAILDISWNFNFQLNSVLPAVEIQTKIANSFVVSPLENFVKMLPPIDLIEKITLMNETLNRIHASFNFINWNQINALTNSTLQAIANFNINLIIIEKSQFSIRLYEYVCESADDELKSIFTLDFIRKIVFNDWWIIPTFDKGYYEDLSRNDGDVFNQLFLNDYYDNPNLIKEMVDNWNLSGIRKKVIDQAIFNYMHGNYETVVIILVLQLEGILREGLGEDKSFSNLRKSLESKLNQSHSNDSWKMFLIKSNICFIYEILWPLDSRLDFKEDIGEVNRNIIAHTGVVEANQLAAIRLIFIIDTLMYIFENL